MVYMTRAGRQVDECGARLEFDFIYELKRRVAAIPHTHRAPLNSYFTLMPVLIRRSSIRPALLLR